MNELEKKRHGCLAVYLGFMMFIGLAGAATYVFAGSFVAAGNPEVPAALRPVFGISNLLVAVSAFALWRWKKWGFWLFVAVGVLGAAGNAYLSGSLLPLFIVPVGILIMYGILHMGKDHQGWNQLE